MANTTYREREQEEEEPLRWEYKVLDVKHVLAGVNLAEYCAELNKLGAEGWELVTETRLDTHFFATLKRPMP